MLITENGYRQENPNSMTQSRMPGSTSITSQNNGVLDIAHVPLATIFTSLMQAAIVKSKESMLRLL